MTTQNTDTAVAPVSELTGLISDAIKQLGFSKQAHIDGSDTYWKPNKFGETWVSINDETGACEIKALNKSGAVTRSEKVTVSTKKLAEKVARLAYSF